MRGEIVFDHVTFRMGCDGDNAHSAQQSPFARRRAKSIAIVGQTGSGKSTLTKLVNRTYDVDERAHPRSTASTCATGTWTSLRSQISTIEQDVFLFSRTIRENIAFGLAQRADQAAIEEAARDAQAHDFITASRWL